MDKDQSGKSNSFERLAAINRAITTSLKFDEVLHLIVVNAMELFEAETSVLVLQDTDGSLRVRAVEGIQSNNLVNFCGRMEETVVKELAELLNLGPGKELMTAPVISAGTLNGFLAVVCSMPTCTTERWQLSALADQAAIALNNSFFHELVTSTAERERDETLAALRQSNEKVTRILSSITDLFYELDLEWRFVDVNKRVEELFGMSRDELIGNVIWDLFPLARDSELYPQFHRAMREMTPVNFDVASQVVLGAWFEVHAYPSSNGLNVYLRDVSSRKSAEVANAHLAAIVESSDDAILSKDLNGIIQTWNKGAERMFGYTSAEVVGKSITILIPDNRYDEETTILQRIRRGQSVDHYETIRRRKDGTLLDISLTISPIRDESGKIIGASKIARDITESKQRSKQIRFQAQLLGAVEQAVIATDCEGIVTYWNSFAERLYGWSEAEAIGLPIFELTAAVAQSPEAVDIFELLKQGRSWSGEFQVRRKDGIVFPAMVSDWPIYDTTGELVGIVGVSVDISERKLAEEERTRLLQAERDARADAERANALKDEFLATLSHELRNPLNVIMGYSELLQRNEQVRNSPFLKNAVEVLRRNAGAQSQLVRDLLDLSRLHMGKLSLTREVVSFASVIDNAVETVRAEAANKQIELEVEIDGEDGLVLGDPLRLEQIVWNLLNNAVKFTPPRGKVRIAIKGDSGDAVLKVVDTGQGIDPAFLPHVFEMFRQADASSSRKHSGMGIGLALVRQLAELHGGSVSASSDGVGRGATFTVRIPLSKEAKRVSREERFSTSRVLEGMQILIVDDSADTLDMLKQLLEIEGAVVCSARGGSQALEVAAGNDFDIVISDISMPEMDGFEFLRRLRGIHRQESVPVLAVTGFGRDEDVQRAKKGGFFAHISKPVDLEQLLTILGELAVQPKEANVTA